MFVTGSIIKPRILTSSSMMASSASQHLLANETVRRCACHLDLHIFSQKIFARRSEIYDAVACGASRPLRARGMVRVDEHFERLADKRSVASRLYLALTLLQDGMAPGLLGFRNRIGH